MTPAVILSLRSEKGHFLVMDYWGCATGLGLIFTTCLTIMGSSFQAFSTELLERGRTFSGLLE